MPFWDFFGSSERQQHHNLQEGLFQIASQTCSILVQVNNTNNISYGNNATNIQNNYFESIAKAAASTSNGRFGSTPYDSEQSLVLLPQSGSSNRGGAKKIFSEYKHRLSVSCFISTTLYYLKSITSWTNI